MDHHKLDKKIDPKKLQFGSKIDQNGSEREEYYTVKEIISPELIRLSNNLIVRLIGVKTEKSISEKAVKFLMDKTKGQRVFLRFDNQKYDDDNHLLCYLYLKNKTFINAHLIKSGLVLPDTVSNYKYKDKFRAYYETVFIRR